MAAQRARWAGVVWEGARREVDWWDMGRGENLVSDRATIAEAKYSISCFNLKIGQLQNMSLSANSCQTDWHTLRSNNCLSMDENYV